MSAGNVQTRIQRWTRDGVSSATDSLAVEEPLAVKIDGETVHITMRTPGHDQELALGFLMSEGIIAGPEDVSVFEPDDEKKENVVAFTLRAGLTIDFGKLARHIVGSSSCGLCGKTAIDRVRLPFPPIASALTVTPETLLAMPRRLREAQATFSATGGIHAAGAFTPQGGLTVAREDIGRHNAVDKILGFGMRQGRIPLRDHVLLVSGRASFEILQKALAGGFPIVAAVSAPSSLAVQFARESRQTLVGFLRDDRFNIYAGAERIT